MSIEKVLAFLMQPSQGIDCEHEKGSRFLDATF